jgi:hypothetical protein
MNSGLREVGGQKLQERLQAELISRKSLSNTLIL